MNETLRKKIGRIFMFGFQGQQPSDSLRQFLSEWGLGGVIVFTRNASDGNAMERLVREVRRAASEPLLLAIDHEGGPVLRLSRGVSQLTGAMAIAATNDPARSRRAGEIAGRELDAMGIDINLAPVLDVNSNPDNPGIGLRSFGETPERVLEYAMPYLQGLQSTGISATAKHFPGKGSASLDAHFDLPLIGRSEEELRRIDFPPFLEAVKRGVDCVMGSHTVYSAYGDELPGTLSPRIMTQLLREEIGFAGPLITDDLEMGAIRDHFGFERAIKSSFLAGADLLLVCHDPEKQRQALEMMEAAVLSGEISEARLDLSVARVDALARRHQERRRRLPSPPLDMLVMRHKKPVEALWRDSVCLVRDPAPLLPLSPGASLAVFCPVLAELSPVEERAGDDPALFELLSASLPKLASMRFTPKQPHSALEEACRLAAGSDVTLFFSYNAHVDPVQAELLEKVRDASRSFVLVALRNPYDLRFARPGDTALASLGFRPDVLRVVANVLLGTQAAAGKLPVRL